MTIRDRVRRGLWGSLLLCALALTACGESATPLSTATPSPARVVSTIGPAPTATIIALPVPTPDTATPFVDAPSPITTTLAPATSAPNAPVTGGSTAAANASEPPVRATGATPTPLAFGIATARATTAVGTARATAAPSTAITGATSGSTTGTVVALTTRPAGTVSATPASTATRAAATTAAMATEVAPTVRSQDTVVNFLNVVLRNGDLSGFLAPGLRGQNGAQLLGVTGNIRMFEVTGERPDPDGSGTVVSATITTASGTVTKQLHMSRSGNVWVIDRVG